MRIKKAHKEKHNTKIAILFVLFVFGVVLIAILLKAVQLVGQSKFDGANRFTVSISSNKNLEVVSFSPSNNTISVLEIEDVKKNLKVGQYLKIPIEGFVESSSLKTDKDVSLLMSNILLNYRNVKTNLTIIDILRLFLASKTTPLKNIITYSISSSDSSDQNLDKLVGKIFKYEKIEKENLTIEIVNGTSVNGLGNRLSTLITNMGGNVIQISTQNNQKNSIIFYNGEKSYTVEKLGKVLGFSTSKTNKQSIADIAIIIGEDNKDPSSF